MKKKLSLILLALLFGLVLVACGGGAAETPADGGDEPADAGEEEPADAGDEEPADAGDQEPADAGDEEPADEGDSGEPSGEPIVVGSTLSLTGGLAPTAIIHHMVGLAYVDYINANGGLLGRPVEWLVLDDESVPDNAGALYERLATEDEVDLMIGPYGTGNITAAMQVAERYGYVFPHHTASLTYAYTYEYHFPTWYVGLHTNLTTPDLVFDALDSTGTPPETIAFVINQFPGTKFLAYGQEGTDEGGAVQVAEEHGYEVVLDVEFPLGTTDFTDIAAQLRDADPDFLYIGAIGVDANNLITAMEAIDYRPAGMFAQWPAPGPLVGMGEPADGIFSVTVFEEHEPFLSNYEADVFVEGFHEKAAEAELPYPIADVQAGASWAAWQVLIAGVEGAGSLDQDEIGQWLLNNTVDSVIGPLTFDPANQNYGPDLQSVKQLQNGVWAVVFPPELANEGWEVQYSPNE